MVHQAFDVLLDTIIKPDALICDAIVQLSNYLFMCELLRMSSSMQ